MKTLDELKAEYEAAREARDAACDVYNDAYAAAGDACWIGHAEFTAASDAAIAARDARDAAWAACEAAFEACLAKLKEVENEN
jgi:hypothetical protein